MADSDEALERALQALREEYLAAAPDRVAELWASMARAASGEPGAVAEVGTLCHRLAGSAGSYGFEAVSIRAREADQFCRRLGDQEPGPEGIEGLKAMVQAIADEFQRAYLQPRG